MCGRLECGVLDNAGGHYEEFRSEGWFQPCLPTCPPNTPAMLVTPLEAPVKTSEAWGTPIWLATPARRPEGRAGEVKAEVRTNGIQIQEKYS